VVTEQAVLDVRPGVEAVFEAAFAEPTKIISSMSRRTSLTSEI